MEQRIRTAPVNTLLYKACLLYTSLASYVGDVLRLMCFDAENQSVSDVTTRLINFIFLYMKSEDYCQTQCIPMSYENLASAVNASRIQIARICSKMKRLGVIDVGRRCITIKKPNALYDLSLIHIFPANPFCILL